MRISDWSSDVCSSDLSKGEKSLVVWAARPWAAGGRHLAQPGQIIMRDQSGFAVACGGETALYVTEWDYQGGGMPAMHARLGGRSEEHTSELQSLTRISYAVFCLKKKNNKIDSTS